MKNVRLMQTPSVADALGGHERRGGKRSSELLLNGQVKELAGAITSPPSDVGKLDSDGHLLGQQNLLDALEENA